MTSRVAFSPQPPFPQVIADGREAARAQYVPDFLHGGRLVSTQQRIDSALYVFVLNTVAGHVVSSIPGACGALSSFAQHIALLVFGKYYIKHFT